MKKSYISKVILSCVAASGAMFVLAACTSNKTNQGLSAYDELIGCDSIPEFIKDIVKAVNENNPERFADEVGYPLQRPYPLKDIQNEEEMRLYYPILVDDSLRNVIINSLPADWQKFGWRGYSLDDGTYLWVDEDIYAVNYVSRREREMIDSLTNIEIASLPPEIAKGWQPILAFSTEDGSPVYRIDKSTSGADKKGMRYRLSIYADANRETLLKMPELMLPGDIEIEGSANIVSYVFSDKDGNSYVIYPEDPSTGVPTVTLPDSTEEELVKAYWYELVR